jgi:hypothetical protein
MSYSPMEQDEFHNGMTTALYYCRKWRMFDAVGRCCTENTNEERWIGWMVERHLKFVPAFEWETIERKRAAFVRWRRSVHRWIV